jgi:hypothetical protein
MYPFRHMCWKLSVLGLQISNSHPKILAQLHRCRSYLCRKGWGSALGVPHFGKPVETDPILKLLHESALSIRQ